MVFEKLRKIICDQLELDEDKITLETNLLDDLGADSLDVVDLVMSIEDEFEMEVPDAGDRKDENRGGRRQIY